MQKGNEGMTRFFMLLGLLFSIGFCCQETRGQDDSAAAVQLRQLLKRFPAADANQDGRLTREEALEFRRRMQSDGSVGEAKKKSSGGGAPREFGVDPGWELERFPEHAVCYLPPEEIRRIFATVSTGPAVISWDAPSDGARRVLGVGHSFMMPGYRTLPLIAAGAGLKQPLYTHTGGGITGSARFKWEQENGIFGFDGNPTPKLLASISNASWDAMTFGPYFNDRPEYFSCWIDFCLKYQPEMKFYISDAWPQLSQLQRNPESEDELTAEVIDRMGQERLQMSREILDVLRTQYPGKVFVLPTSDAMVLAAKYFLRGELPGVEGLHRVIGGRQKSLWADQLGHLGPGFDRLEGYVFYATLYGRSPELITQEIQFGGNNGYPGTALDAQFRRIAWQAVAGNSYSGVVDVNKDGLNDRPESSDSDAPRR